MFVYLEITNLNSSHQLQYVFLYHKIIHLKSRYRLFLALTIIKQVYILYKGFPLSFMDQNLMFKSKQDLVLYLYLSLSRKFKRRKFSKLIIIFRSKDFTSCLQLRRRPWMYHQIQKPGDEYHFLQHHFLWICPLHLGFAICSLLGANLSQLHRTDLISIEFETTFDE